MLKVSFVSMISAAVVMVPIFLPSCNHRETSSVESSVANKNTEEKRIFFILGPLIRSISVGDLEKFTSSGIANGDIGNIVNFGNLDAQKLSAQLKKEYQLDFVQVSHALNSSFGVALLNKLGEAVHPLRNKTTAVQALRSAIVMSLEDDNKLTPLEVLKNLPVNMAVEIEVILKMRDELSGLLPQG